MTIISQGVQRRPVFVRALLATMFLASAPLGVAQAQTQAQQFKPDLNAGEKIAAMERAQLYARLEKEEAKTAALEAKLAAAEAKLMAMDVRLQGMVGGINRAQPQIDKLSNDFSVLNNSFKTHRHTYDKGWAAWENVQVVQDAHTTMRDDKITVGSFKGLKYEDTTTSPPK